MLPRRWEECNVLNDDAVVITGLGLVTPIGTGKTNFWNSLIAGTNGIRTITSFDSGEFRTHRGGEVHDFDPSVYCRNLDHRRIGRGAQMAIAAARLAFDDGGINVDNTDPSRTAVILGTTMGESPIAETIDSLLAQHGGLDAVRNGRVSPLTFPQETISSNVAREFGFRGPVSLMATACAAGNYAIGYGADLLQSGEVDLVLAGGSDPFSRVAFTGFNSMLAVAPEMCQPFDRHRKGMLVSEGAAALLLERCKSARLRGAVIYAEVAGYGISNDGHHMTAPHPTGRGASCSITNALAAAKTPVDSVGYINAHGTGTPANDKIETLAIKRVFGDTAFRTPVSSIKSMLGHTMGAASAIEAAASALTIQRGIVPPTINYRERDPECDLDYVPNCAREVPIRTVLSNSFAFGGNCAALVLRAV
jgi:3-oxoacyl-[acyl-carrier-protein] synthase II